MELNTLQNKYEKLIYSKSINLKVGPQSMRSGPNPLLFYPNAYSLSPLLIRSRHRDIKSNPAFCVAVARTKISITIGQTEILESEVWNIWSWESLSLKQRLAKVGGAKKWWRADCVWWQRWQRVAVWSWAIVSVPSTWALPDTQLRTTQRWKHKVKCKIENCNANIIDKPQCW